jgi:hypothetical protein
MIVCDASALREVCCRPDRRGVKVTTMNATDHAQACGLFMDAVQQKTVKHLGSLELRNAVKGAAVRPLNDSWAFSRKNSGVDICRLCGCDVRALGRIHDRRRD